MSSTKKTSQIGAELGSEPYSERRFVARFGRARADAVQEEFPDMSWNQRYELEIEMTRSKKPGKIVKRAFRQRFGEDAVTKYTELYPDLSWEKRYEIAYNDERGGGYSTAAGAIGARVAVNEPDIDWEERFVAKFGRARADAMEEMYPDYAWITRYQIERELSRSKKPGKLAKRRFRSVFGDDALAEYAERYPTLSWEERYRIAYMDMYGGGEYATAATKLQAPTTTPTCAVCAKPATHACSRCDTTFYCGAVHQAVHWASAGTAITKATAAAAAAEAAPAHSTMCVGDTYAAHRHWKHRFEDRFGYRSAMEYAMRYPDATWEQRYRAAQRDFAPY